MTLIIAGGVHAVKFDNQGNKIGEVSLGDQVPNDPKLRRGLTGGHPMLEAAMDGFLSRKDREPVT
jgi:hypothetical protein